MMPGLLFGRAAYLLLERDLLHLLEVGDRLNLRNRAVDEVLRRFAASGTQVRNVVEEVQRNAAEREGEESDIGRV